MSQFSKWPHLKRSVPAPDLMLDNASLLRNTVLRLQKGFQADVEQA